MKEIWWKIASAWRRDALQDELRDEIRSHLEMKAADAGDTRLARQQFGNAVLVLEDARAVWGWPGPEAWLRDFRYGMRMMRRRPAFAVTIAAILAIGIGSSSTVFSLVDAVLIRPLPYPQADKLVSVYEVRSSGERTETRVAPARLWDWNRLAQGFEVLAGSYVDSFTETSGSVPEQIPGATVTAQFFAVFRMSPVLGRVFSSEEERFGGPSAVVISERLWRRRFNSDPSVLGRTLLLSGKSHAIVGVMPAAFQYPAASTDLWAPHQTRPALLQVRSARFFDCVGRVKGSVTLAQARADLELVQRKLGEQYPQSDSGWTVSIDGLKDRVIGKVRLALWLLFGSAIVLLLIACTNVACLLLAQASSRAEELATRRALGAGRSAIARQLLAEGLAYALAGSFGGVALTFAAVPVVQRILRDLPRITELTVDPRLLIFAVVVSIAAAIFFSVAPILQTVQRGSGDALIRSGRGVIGRRQVMSRLLVSAQLALATVLLIGSGLFLKSLLRLQETPLGFRTGDVLTFRVSASFKEGAESVSQWHQRTLDALAALPGVRSVAMSSGAPGTFSGAPIEFRLAGPVHETNSDDYHAAQRRVTSSYFESLGIPILSGGTCRMDPGPQQPFEALVNEAFVRRFLPAREAVGLTVTHGPPDSTRVMRIVGVVGDTREAGYARAPEPLIYACGFLRYWPDSHFLIRTSAALETMTRAVLETIGAVEPARAVYGLQPLSGVLSETLSQNRFRTWLIGTFSAFALILAAVGLYGVTAYMVSQRTRELGIRIALGARPSQIWSEILQSGVTLVAIGAGAGVILAWMASRLIGALLYNVGTFEISTYLYAVAVLFAAAVLACLPPGLRATSIDPARALREG